MPRRVFCCADARAPARGVFLVFAEKTGKYRRSQPCSFRKAKAGMRHAHGEAGFGDPLFPIVLNNGSRSRSLRLGNRSDSLSRRPPSVSPAGLTHGSIFLRNNVFAKKMDCRVKPGNDGL